MKKFRVWFRDPDGWDWEEVRAESKRMAMIAVRGAWAAMSDYYVEKNVEEVE